ncbi:MAG TPA: nitroreductase family protein [Candidatus Methanoperedenaceae archaeon]|nr:nitroreductase family protein [Candidatus Methanoperedenaceae archaeon]
MDILECIRSRRSVREFKDTPVEKDSINAILDAGRWAPSGLNDQPWRFIVVRERETRERLAGLTRYGHIIEGSKICIAVFLDREVMYDYVKDVQAVGACIQNMLLAAHALGLGAVWLGEILKNREHVNEELVAPKTFELMAVIALGYPVERKRHSDRQALEDVSFSETCGRRWVP